MRAQPPSPLPNKTDQATCSACPLFAKTGVGMTGQILRRPRPLIEHRREPSRGFAPSGSHRRGQVDAVSERLTAEPVSLRRIFSIAAGKTQSLNVAPFLKAQDFFARTRT